MDTLSSLPSLETRESLIEAGLACFAKYGYEATSIRLVASVAGRNSSLISYYFKNKEGLYRAVFQNLLARFSVVPVEESTHDFGHDKDRANNAKLRLRSHLRRILLEVDAHFQSAEPLRESAARLFLSELQSPKEEVRDLLQEQMEPSVRELRACIQAIRPDLSPADIDFWGITIIGSCIGHSLMGEINHLVWTSADPHLSVEDMADRLIDFAFKGLAPP